MSKSIGPCFEFVAKKEGADIDFVFLPGNIAKKVYTDTCNALYAALESFYSVSVGNYVKKVEREDGLTALAIRQTKVLSVIRNILETPAYRGFKVKITGFDKEGQEKTVMINTPTEYQHAAEVIPYFNKNNNDLTTRRRK